MHDQHHPTTATTRRAALKDSRIEQLRRMHEIRAVEDAIGELFKAGRLPGTTHTCQGQEAVSVAIAAATETSDHVACTYRGHGVALALGLTPTQVLGEVMGRREGAIRGLGGSMHLADESVGLLPTMAIVGAGIPVAVGAALTAQLLDTGAVAVSVFGDGATNIGAFHEGLNLAAVWRLPVIFVCENNLYGEYSPLALTTSVRDIATRAGSYGISARIVDGQDSDRAGRELRDAVEAARNGAGPQLLEMKTYRFAGHSRSDPATYRPSGELEAWMRRDPITVLSNRLVEDGELPPDGSDEMARHAHEATRQVVERLQDAEPPTLEDMFAHVYA